MKLWFSTVLNVQFEALLYMASTRFLGHLTVLAKCQLAFDGDFLCTVTTGVVLVNAAYSKYVGSDFFRG